MENQAISNKIIEDAKRQAEAIVSKALADADFARAECAKSCESQLNEAKKQATSKGEKVIERNKTIARLDAKKVVLEGKQSLIKRAVLVAKQRLCQMNAQEYLDFVEKQLNTYADLGDKIIICSSAPISAEQVNALSVCSQRNLTAVKGEAFGGGIKLTGAKSDKDLSFDAIVERYLVANTQEISAMLFK